MKRDQNTTLAPAIGFIVVDVSAPGADGYWRTLGPFQSREDAIEAAQAQNRWRGRWLVRAVRA